MRLEDGTLLLTARCDAAGRLLAAPEWGEPGWPTQGAAPPATLSELVGVCLRHQARDLDPAVVGDLVRRLSGPRPAQVTVQSAGTDGADALSFAVWPEAEGGRRLLVSALPVPQTQAAEAPFAADILQTAIDLLPATISLKDAERRYVFVNRRWEAYAGLDRSAVLGRRHEELRLETIAADSFEAHTEAIRDRDLLLLRTGEPVLNREERYVDLEGVEQTLLSNKVPLTGRDGRVGGILSITVDISQQQQAIVALTKAKARAEEADRAKSRFLASVSHELRTPLHAIGGLTELLSVNERDPERRAYLDLLRDAGQQLLDLVNDILDLSQLDTNRSSLEERDFSLTEDLKRVAGMLERRLEAKDVQFTWRIDPAVPSVLYGDDRKLRQILLHLLDNAIKFTDRGRIDVTIGVEVPAPAQSGTLTLRGTVRDTGAGIRPENLSRIFDLFEREQTYPEEDLVPGRGLGLPIAKRLATLLGGTLQAESEPGVGSCFVFTCRLRPGPVSSGRSQPVRAGPPVSGAGPAAVKVPAGTGQRAAAAGTAGTRILIAEDDPYSAALIAHLLQGRGYQVQRARSAPEVLAGLDRPGLDLLVLDPQLPDLDGLDLVQRIRAGHLARTRADLPILALASFAQRHERQRGLDLGIDAFLTKPVDGEEVLSAVGELLQVESGTARSPA